MFMGFGKRGFCTVFLVFLTILVCGNIHKKKETGWFVQGLLSALDSSWAKEVFAEEKTKTQTVSKYPLTVQFIDNPFPLQEREKAFRLDSTTPINKTKKNIVANTSSSSFIPANDPRNPIAREEVNVSSDHPDTRERTQGDVQGKKELTSRLTHGARELRQPSGLNKRGNAQDGRLGGAKCPQQGRHSPYPAMPSDSRSKASSGRSPQKRLEHSPRRSGDAPQSKVKDQKSSRAGSGLQPESLDLLNTGVCSVDTISKGINTGVQVVNLNPQ